MLSIEAKRGVHELTRHTASVRQTLSCGWCGPIDARDHVVAVHCRRASDMKIFRLNT